MTDADKLEQYRDRQLHKYLEENESQNSDCCNASILPDSDVCSECHEHCVTVTEAHEMYLDDKADAQREEARDDQKSSPNTKETSMTNLQGAVLVALVLVSLASLFMWEED